MRERTVKYIVKELGQHRPENDIVRTVVYLEDVSWEEANRIVADVKIRYQGRIVRRRSPLLVAVGLVTFIGGLALSVGMIIATLEGVVLFFFSMPVPYSGNIGFFLIGLGMMAGSAFGTGSAILDFLTARDQKD